VPFRFALMLEDGEPADPAAFVTAAPDCHGGDVFMPRGGERFPIVEIEPTLDAGLPFHATWTIEPLPG